MSRQTVAENILKAYRVADDEKVYCVVPQAGRINFASQQIRAFNLVWAISTEFTSATENPHPENRICFPENTKVAVIGAGVAGITMAAAFYAAGAQVDLFESKSEPMWQQEATKHRIIHPSINWWPEDDAINPTTDFPFMNWAANQCNITVGKIGEQWKKICSSGSNANFIPNTPIKKYYQQTTASNTVVLEDESGLNHRGYSIVVISCGFGAEHKFGEWDTKRYWEHDDLETWRKRALENNYQAVISGTGDGGLIDALRLAFDFEQGKLAFEIAAMSKGTFLEKELQRESLTKADFERIIREVGRDPECEDIAKKLEIADTKKASFVYLLDGQNDTAFDTGAAPIHKLLIAYAIASRTVEFVATNLPDYDDKKESFCIVDSYNNKVVFNQSTTKVIVRHGAKVNFAGLLSGEKIEELQQRDQFVSDCSHRRAWPDEEFLVPEELPCRVNRCPEFITYFKKSLQETLELVGFGEATVSVSESNFVISGADKSCQRFTSFFGLPVKYEDEPKSFEVA